MQSEQIKRLADKIYYVPASENPLSADVFFIEAGERVYIYDVGSSVAAREQIEAVTRGKIIVLSHFHADHTANVPEITFEELYAGKETVKHTGIGKTVDKEIILEADVPIRLVPLPSSHAKDCVALCYGTEYAFCGDATYATGKKFPSEEAARCLDGQATDGKLHKTVQNSMADTAYVIKHVYNSQKLKAMLEVLKRLDVKYLVLSHDTKLVYPKEDVIRSLEMIYKRREKDSPYILL